MLSRPRDRAEVVGAGTSRLVSRFSSLCQSAAFVRWHFTLRRFSPSSRRWLCSFFYSKSTFSFLPDCPPPPRAWNGFFVLFYSLLLLFSFCLCRRRKGKQANKRVPDSWGQREKSLCGASKTSPFTNAVCVLGLHLHVSFISQPSWKFGCHLFDRPTFNIRSVFVYVDSSLKASPSVVVFSAQIETLGSKRCDHFLHPRCLCVIHKVKH